MQVTFSTYKIANNSDKKYLTEDNALSESSKQNFKSIYQDSSNISFEAFWPIRKSKKSQKQGEREDKAIKERVKNKILKERDGFKYGAYSVNKFVIDSIVSETNKSNEHIVNYLLDAKSKTKGGDKYRFDLDEISQTLQCSEEAFKLIKPLAQMKNKDGEYRFAGCDLSVILRNYTLDKAPILERMLEEDFCSHEIGDTLNDSNADTLECINILIPQIEEAKSFDYSKLLTQLDSTPDCIDTVSCVKDQDAKSKRFNGWGGFSEIVKNYDSSKKQILLFLIEQKEHSRYGEINRFGAHNIAKILEVYKPENDKLIRKAIAAKDVNGQNAFKTVDIINLAEESEKL